MTNHFVAMEVGPDGRVRVALVPEVPTAFATGELPPSGFNFCWVALEPEETDHAVDRIYAAPTPHLHVVNGVSGVQSWRGEDGQLHVFVSPSTHSKLLYQAKRRSHGASLQATVYFHQTP